MFSSKIVNDVTESIIRPYRQLINVRRFTLVQLINGKESNCKLIQTFFYFEVVTVCSFVCSFVCNGVCKSGLSCTKSKFE